ncbi:hypothetical protein N9Y89_01185 [bacterium]|nr:hypothetical protein [bacterium]
MEENENIEEVKSVDEQPQVEEQVEREVDLSKFESADDPDVIKVDLSKPLTTKENADTEQEATDVVTDEQAEVVQEVVEEVSPRDEAVQTEEPVAESTEVEDIGEALKEAEEAGNPVPENLQKLVDFMNQTGGSVNDYVNLNKDYSEMDNLTALKEYYKTTKPHLSGDEIEFLLEDQFKYEEDVDDENLIRKKKIALKEQVAEAKAYLDGQKSKYYEEIKSGSKLPDEAQKAIEFFNRYNEESEQNAKQQEMLKDKFLKKTDNVFTSDFKGFEYEVGDKRFRFNVKNADEVKNTQSDINNFVQKFLDKDGTMSDAKGYHKSLYTAMNADAVAKHFYEQGKADALKESVAKAKNVDMSPRQGHNTIEAGGLKFKVLGDDTATFKFRGKKGRK